MKTKTSNLIEKFLKEELNQIQPQQGQVPITNQVQQPATNTSNIQANNQSSSNNQEEKQKVEVYIPLHDGRFTNRIFSTSKDVNIKVLYDNVEDDMKVMEEIENNPNAYHQIEPHGSV